MGSKLLDHLSTTMGLDAGSGWAVPTAEQARVVLTGQPGSGKSTFLNSCKSMFIIDPERGGRTVSDPKAMRFPATDRPATADDYRKVFQQLIKHREKEGDNSDFSTIGIDSYDYLIYLFQRDLATKYSLEDVGDYSGGHGKGYRVVGDELWGYIDALHNMGVGWWIVMHQRAYTKKLEQDDAVTYRFGVSDSYKYPVKQRCEHVLFLDRGVERIKKPPKIVSLPGGKTKEISQGYEQKEVRLLSCFPFLNSTETAADVKVRLPLPEKIVVPDHDGWSSWVDAYNASVYRLKNPTASASAEAERETETVPNTNTKTKTKENDSND